jgi:hypothetical protein
MTPDQRREVHQRLAASSCDIEERARHLVLAADRPCDEVGRALDASAEHAALKGGPEAAAALEEQATRLTLGSDPNDTRDRTVRAADYHFRAGDITRSRELIDAALDACPADPPRGPLLLQLATIHYHQSGWPVTDQTFRQAAQAAPDDPALRAHRAGTRLCPAGGR